MNEQELEQWAQSLTEQQLNFLCDNCFYNYVMKGYVLTAAEIGELDEIQTRRLMKNFDCALSEKSAADAEQTYITYMS